MIRWSSKIVRHASPTTTTPTATATSSGDMHHPRHRFITAVGTGTSPRSFLVSSKHTTVCLGLSVRSNEHPDVLSEKINFSALGGLKSAKFDPGPLDPIYFEVGNFSASPDPPYMSKNAQMC